MSQKFHINSKGVPAPCRAIQGNCPFGGNDGTENHYDTIEEAQVAADVLNEKEHEILPKVDSYEDERNGSSVPFGTSNHDDMESAGQDYDSKMSEEFGETEEKDSASGGANFEVFDEKTQETVQMRIPTQSEIEDKKKEKADEASENARQAKIDKRMRELNIDTLEASDSGGKASSRLYSRMDDYYDRELKSLEKPKRFPWVSLRTKKSREKLAIKRTQAAFYSYNVNANKKFIDTPRRGTESNEILMNDTWGKSKKQELGHEKGERKDLDGFEITDHRNARKILKDHGYIVRDLKMAPRPEDEGKADVRRLLNEESIMLANEIIENTRKSDHPDKDRILQFYSKMNVER